MPPPPPLQPQPGSSVPLSAPYYNAPFGVAVRRFFAKYATFSGRASRSEYWWWALVAFLVSIVLNVILTASGGNQMGSNGMMTMNSGGAVFVSIIAGLYGLATIIPSLALLSRRLHDTNHSAGWIFILLIPIVGSIIILVFVLTGPRPEGARFDR